jgi:hypothetical protein
VSRPSFDEVTCGSQHGGSGRLFGLLLGFLSEFLSDVESVSHLLASGVNTDWLASGQI